MKRLSMFAAWICVCVAANVSAAGLGSARVPFDPAVGWALVNTTGNGGLIVLAHLDDGLPNQEFDVTVRVRYEDDTVVVFDGVAVLATNDDGVGTAFAYVVPTPPEGSGTIRRIAVRVRRAPTPLYVAIFWDLPLKTDEGARGLRTR